MASTKMDVDKENQTNITNKKNGAAYQIPWIEKYRPLTLDEVVGNEETVMRLEAISQDGNLPNLILSGPPGTGKVRVARMSTTKRFDLLPIFPAVMFVSAI